jgi:hypothetical protein
MESKIQKHLRKAVVFVYFSQFLFGGIAALKKHRNSVEIDIIGFKFIKLLCSKLIHSFCKLDHFTSLQLRASKFTPKNYIK